MPDDPFIWRGQLFEDPLPIQGPVYPGPEFWRDRERRAFSQRLRRNLYYPRRPPWATCLSLDGASAYVLIGAAGAPAILQAPAGAWSLASWSRLRTPPANALVGWDGVIIGASWGQIEEVNNVGTLLVSGNSTTAAGSVNTSTTPLIDFAWHHVALTYDGVAFLKLYIDGVLIQQIAQTLAPVNSANFGIGCLPGALPPTLLWAGQLSDIRVYSVALILGMVQEIYGAGRGLPFAGSAAANLIGWWPLNQIGIQDQSAQNNAGTLVGSARIVFSA